jgi:nitrite reductase/ring-hydroxylating ferredoxin subunit
MKRSDELAIVTRRGFCGGIASCLGLTLVSCKDGDWRVVETGPLTGSDDPTVDASTMRDGSMIDGGGGACPTTGATDVGAPSTFSLLAPVYFSSGNFFVVRDSGGLYALTAKCTHAGVTITAETSDFLCMQHGATFDFDGNVTNGPAFLPLVHYAMCTLASGHVGVIKTQTVPQSQRLAV